MRALLRQVVLVADFIESHLSQGSRPELSEALVHEVRRELEALSLEHLVVVAFGDANNFTTRHGDLCRHVFGPLNPPGDSFKQPFPIAVFKIPRIEGPGVQWRPILLGHEVAHVAVAERNALQQFNVWEKLGAGDLPPLPSPAAAPDQPELTKRRELYKIANSWATELLCDAYALQRFGPAAVAAMGDYFTTIGALDALSVTHPPGKLRLQLLIDRLPELSGTRLEKVIEPWKDLVTPAESFGVPWADHLAQLFLGHSADLSSTVAAFGCKAYVPGEQEPIVAVLADLIKKGIPGYATVNDEDSHAEPTDVDVVNAVWVTRVEGDAAQIPIDRLGKKAIESLEFVRRWKEHGGLVPFGLSPASPGSPPKDIGGVGAALSTPALERRLQSTDDDTRLIATPLVHRPDGAGLDLRLGNRFIVFKRVLTAYFDPLESNEDPRSMQVHMELSWHETFVLHPQEVVLGTTLEYLVLPGDLTGQVVTRSSYGRLGILSATAVQVHPHFHGCLTLELVNLGTIPVVLTPGERIAQLVLWHTDPVPRSNKRYDYAIGPEFSKVRDDMEARLLRELRSND
jgi:deoxycytidine triphosphate deaminase